MSAQIIELPAHRAELFETFSTAVLGLRHSLFASNIQLSLAPHMCSFKCDSVVVLLDKLDEGRLLITVEITIDEAQVVLLHYELSHMPDLTTVVKAYAADAHFNHAMTARATNPAMLLLTQLLLTLHRQHLGQAPGTPPTRHDKPTCHVVTLKPKEGV